MICATVDQGVVAAAPHEIVLDTKNAVLVSVLSGLLWRAKVIIPMGYNYNN